MKVPRYHLSSGNGNTHENLLRLNETSSKYRQTPTSILIRENVYQSQATHI